MRSEVSAYSQAAGSGRYDRPSGLRGKYDNVRIFWEDQITRHMLRPHLEPVVRRLEQGRGLRVADLGCGSGDGFEILISVARSRPPLEAESVQLIPRERLGRYTGVDINLNLLDQARARYGGAEDIELLQADLREGLPFRAGEAPYDVYFTSFGTLSHFHDEALVPLLADVARHAEGGALVIGDWLGRYAYEWTSLWDADTSREKWMDYRISYIYPEQERATRKIEGFDLRLMCDEEIRRIVARAEAASGARLRQRALFDRSLFVGRHIDTAEYNPHAVPLRSPVNHLHEPLHRTDLDSLLFDLHLPDGFAGPAELLTDLHAAWTDLVRFTRDTLARAGASGARAVGSREFPASRSEPARRAMQRMSHVIEASTDWPADDVRAELIEPQLGFALRDLEIAHQRGKGYGHGLVGIYEVVKS
jgi:SAM-dependent methyltransferase